MIPIIIGIDHGYYAIKTPHICFPTGLSVYEYEPYTMQNVLQYQGKYYVCGTGRQTLQNNKTANDHFYYLTMAALAQEIRYRKAERKTEVYVKLFPQGYSALALHPEFITGEPSVLLINIGGWTVDLMRLDNGVPNASTCRSLELGDIRCIDEIMEQVRRSTGLSVTGVQIERVLGGHNCSMASGAKEIILRQGRL